MLCVDQGSCRDAWVTDLPGELQAGDLLVFNDTKVIPARLFAAKDTGGRVEMLIERITGETRALAQIKASKAPKPGSEIHVHDNVVKVLGRINEFFDLEFPCPVSILLEQHGHMPLPPYIQREDDDQDLARYQTVFAKNPGAVAAPTAGLHFSNAMFDQLNAQGIETAYVTLHVGAGTFQPVRADNLEDHVMHRELLQVEQGVVDAISRCRERGGRVVAVGTTTVRSLETAALGGELAAFEGESNLFLYPGAEFKVVDALLTNFHLPESTLLMLVCAFAGTELMLRAYRHAVKEHYRFFSYGDACFILKSNHA